MSGRSRLLGWGLGIAGGGLAALGLVLGVHLAPVIAVPIAAAVGAGVGLLGAPMRPAELARLGFIPTSTGQMLDASSSSADAMRKAVRRLGGRPFWGASGLDGELLRLCDSIDGLAEQPALRSRTQSDGEVQTLFTVATDYLPTVVNLCIENDRMHTSFTSGRPRAEIARNVESLAAQTGVLGEVLERIESDVVRGVSRDAEQHAEFLRMRFEQTGGADLLDLGTPLARQQDARTPEVQSQDAQTQDARTPELQAPPPGSPAESSTETPNERNRP